MWWYVYVMKNTFNNGMVMQFDIQFVTCISIVYEYICNVVSITKCFEVNKFLAGIDVI